MTDRTRRITEGATAIGKEALQRPATLALLLSLAGGVLWIASKTVDYEDRVRAIVRHEIEVHDSSVRAHALQGALVGELKAGRIDSRKALEALEQAIKQVGECRPKGRRR